MKFLYLRAGRPAYTGTPPLKPCIVRPNCIMILLLKCAQLYTCIERHSCNKDVPCVTDTRAIDDFPERINQVYPHFGGVLFKLTMLVHSFDAVIE